MFTINRVKKGGIGVRGSEDTGTYVSAETPRGRLAIRFLDESKEDGCSRVRVEPRPETKSSMLAVLGHWKHGEQSKSEWGYRFSTMTYSRAELEAAVRTALQAVLPPEGSGSVTVEEDLPCWVSQLIEGATVAALTEEPASAVTALTEEPLPATVESEAQKRARLLKTLKQAKVPGVNYRWSTVVLEAKAAEFCG